MNIPYLKLVPPPYDCLFKPHVMQDRRSSVKILTTKIQYTAARLCLVAITTVAYFTMQAEVKNSPAPFIVCAFASLPAAIITGGNFVISKAILTQFTGIAAKSLQQIALGSSAFVIGW